MSSEEDTTSPPSGYEPTMNQQDLVPDSVPAIESQRVLLGFLGPDDAIGRLRQADQVRSPADATESGEKTQQELEREAREATDRFREQWQEARQAIPDTAPSHAEAVDVKGLPDDPEIEDHLAEYTEKGVFREVMAEVPDEQWSFKRVPIDSLVAFQPQVTTTAYQEIPSWDDDPSASWSTASRRTHRCSR